MSKVRVKLASLFRSKATEENKSEETKTEEAKPAEEGGGESETTEEGEGESYEEAETGTETTEEGEGDTQTGTPEEESVEEVEMIAAEFNKQRADASAWNRHKAEFETLKSWKATMDGMGKGLAKNDQTDRNGKTTSTVFDQPWNKEAIDAAERVK